MIDTTYKQQVANLAEDFGSILDTNAPLFWVLELLNEKVSAEEALLVEAWMLDDASGWNTLLEVCPFMGSAAEKHSEALVKALCETKARILAPLDHILESTKDLENHKTPLVQAKTVDLERIFLRSFAINRSDQKEAAARVFEQLSALSLDQQDGSRSENELRHQTSLKDRCQLELLVNELNKDNDALVVKETLLLLSHKNLDVISQIRTLAILGLAAGELGLFDLLEKALTLEKNLLLKLPLQSLYQTWKRRRAHAYLRQNKFAAASELIEEGLAETENLPPVQALFLSLKVELSLLRGSTGEAQKQLLRLQKHVLEGAIPIESTQIQSFILELALLSVTFDGYPIENLFATLPILEKICVKSDGVEDVFSLAHVQPVKELQGGAQIRASLTVARVLMKQKLHTQAQSWIFAAIAAAEQSGYSPLLLEAHFHNAGLQFSLRNSIEMKRSLEAARDLAKNLGLRLKQACFQYVVSYLRNKATTQLKPLLELLAASPAEGYEAEIVYVLNHYGFLNFTPRRVQLNTGEVLVLDEGQFWSEWLTKPILLWCKAEGLLFLRSGSNTKVLFKELLLSKGLTQVVDLFLLQNMSVSLQDVHQLFSAVPYSTSRHEPQSRSMISRLRKEFEAIGVEVKRNDESEKYEASEKELLNILLVKLLND